MNEVVWENEPSQSSETEAFYTSSLNNRLKEEQAMAFHEPMNWGDWKEWITHLWIR